MSTQLPEILDRSRIINVKQMAEVLGFSIPHLRRLYRTGRIPAPTKIGERKLGWTAAVVMDLTASSHSGKDAA